MDADAGLTAGLGGLAVAIIGLIQCGKRQERGKALAIIGIVCGAISVMYPFTL